MDNWVAMLKVLSLLVGGLFGILGLATEYKDSKKRITRWGKIALGGILISTLIALTLYGVEASRAKVAANKAEADALKREEEAKAFANSLRDLLAKAQDGMTKQEQALSQLKTLGRDTETTLQGQRENLRQTSQVSKGLETTLAQQNTLLRGQEKTASSQLEQIKLQEKVLDESRLLYLAQYKVSKIEVSWELSADVIKGMKSVFGQRDSSTKKPLFRDAEYLSAALDDQNDLDRNFIGIKLDWDNTPRYLWSLTTKQMSRGGYLKPESIEGQLFEMALSRIAQPSLFRMTIEPGTILNRGTYPILISGGRVILTIQNPDVMVSQLQNVVFTFHANADDADMGESFLPKKVRIKLLDDRVDFISEVNLEWRDCSKKRVVAFDTAYQVSQGGMCASTAPASANFDKLLSPLRLGELSHLN